MAKSKLANLSLSAMKTEIARRAKNAAKLMTKRNKIAAELAALDAQIAELQSKLAAAFRRVSLRP